MSALRMAREAGSGKLNQVNSVSVLTQVIGGEHDDAAKRVTRTERQNNQGATPWRNGAVR